MCNNFFPEKKRVFNLIIWKKYFRAGQAADEIQSTCIASCVPKAINTRPEYIVGYLLGFHAKSSYTNAPQSFVTVHCLSC